MRTGWRTRAPSARHRRRCRCRQREWTLRLQATLAYCMLAGCTATQRVFTSRANHDCRRIWFTRSAHVAGRGGNPALQHRTHLQLLEELPAQRLIIVPDAAGVAACWSAAMCTASTGLKGSAARPRLFPVVQLRPVFPKACVVIQSVQPVRISWPCPSAGACQLAGRHVVLFRACACFCILTETCLPWMCAQK